MNQRLPFWSDDFDMDLLKIYPHLEPILDAVEATLYVHGGESFGRLNHPAVWNSDGGYIAFFSFNPSVPCKPESYYCGSKSVIQCTWTEAVRDNWAHHYILTVDRVKILDCGPMREQFQAIMYDLRGWQKTTKEKLNSALCNCEVQIRNATKRIQTVAARFQMHTP